MRIAKLLGTVGAVLALSACASTPSSPEPDMVQAQPVTEPPPPPMVLSENPVKAEKVPKTDKEVFAMIRQALKDSKRSLGECSYEGARAVCPWMDGHIYTMYLKAGEISTIHMNRDEQIIDHHLSKDRFFTTKPNAVGSEDGALDVLVVQAWMPGARTKVTILTNRREYQINLITNRMDYNPSMRFVYPEQMAAGLSAPPEREVPVESATKIPLGRLNVRYTASGQIGELKGEQLQVMDDGKKTYVIFPEGVAIRPPFFAKADGHGNNVEMTTDVSGNYIVQGVYRSAELQVGDQLITIKRGR